MKKVRIKDKTFRLMMTEEEILRKIDVTAARINRDMKGKNPLFIGVLNGVFMFAADLMKRITVPCEISFVKVASYDGITSTGKVKELIGINEKMAGRTVIILEDIVESGLTMARMIDTLKTREPAEIHVCTMFVKPEKLQKEIDIDYGVTDIPNDFIVGYGLDYDQQGRNLKDLYVLCED